MQFILDQPLRPSEIKLMGQPSAESIVAALKELADDSFSLSHAPIGAPHGLTLDRFVYLGNRGGGDPIKIGIFAGIHGDEPAGSLALVELVKLLEANPALGEGYQLFLYPVCNPTGFDACTRFGASGKDLNREFWKNSPEEEVRLLEAEMLEHKFLGLVSLHSHDTSRGLYGFVRGDVLAKNLLEPALQAAEKIIPRDLSETIDGFHAENGIISTCYEGILTAPLRTTSMPFEIIFETPAQAPIPQQVKATVVALEQILSQYRKFLAFAADL
ncbi:MAG: hypothetical protein ACO1QB_03910 [Verrucomicrobiales bacterium]